MKIQFSPIVSRGTFRSLRGLFPAALFALVAPFVHAAGDSLLPDGSLEIPNSSGEWPLGWGKAKNVRWESEAGNFFFRLVSPAPGTHVNLYQKVVLPADVTALELSYRVRVSGIEVGVERWYDARIIMNFRDAAGKITTAKPTPYYNRSTEGWVLTVHRIEVPAGSVTLEFLPSLFRVTSGVFDLDDIVLKPIERISNP